MGERECRPIRDDLVAYADGELDPAGRAAVDHHLRGCADCGRELDQLRGTALLVREVRPGDDMEERGRAALARARRSVRALARARRRPILGFIQRLLDDPVEAFAAAVFVSVAVARALDVLGLEDEGVRALSYLLSLGLS